MSTVNPGDVLAWIALAAAVVMGARGGIQRQTISALREQNEAYSGREAQHQKDLSEMKAQRTAKDAQTDAALKRLGDRNTYLEELVLRRQEGQEVIDVMKTHDSEAAARHAVSIKTLREIRDAQKERIQVDIDLLAEIATLSTRLEGKP